MENVKKIAVVAVFALMIFGFACAHWLLPDAQYSDTERRALTKKPEYSSDKLYDGTYTQELEAYLLDQFPLRDTFRGIKTAMNMRLLQMKDINGYYYAEGHWMQMERETDTKQIEFAIKQFNKIISDHPEIANSYYAIIPDKNYFLAERNGYPSMDYDAIYEMAERIDAEQIDLRPTLTVSDYYRTDSHWRQECLTDTVKLLCEAMDAPKPNFDSYTKLTKDDFSGVYADHTAELFISEKLHYLENETMKNAKVRLFDGKSWKESAVYNEDAYYGVDPYDFYLSGVNTLITIENPEAKSDRHLVIVRDSFTSSLAPLLIDSYAKITLLDLRGIAARNVGAMVDFENADLLILQSTTMLNQAGEAFKKF